MPTATPRLVGQSSHEEVTLRLRQEARRLRRIRQDLPDDGGEADGNKTLDYKNPLPASEA